ncbi:aminopeptidase [Clostridium sp. 19966]|uniref:aminopeptidase n=1 Tax=Clostridium sp. 19966 TaxID=2768166 RepID=UPI0028DEB14B|nr:aminopeptidase [Clostridium sp. 19966]MDT8718745.1 aminopeptidase [Clostridium sp. 19966]
MKDTRLNKLAKVLVNYSTKVKPGDFVFISGDIAIEPWVVEVAKEAVRAGAHVETSMSSQNVTEAILKNATDEQLMQEGTINKVVMEKADVWLSAWGGTNTKSFSNISGEKFKLRAQGNKKSQEIYLKRIGDGSLRWCGTMFPTVSDAQEAAMSLEEYEDFVYGAGLVESDDPAEEWRKISEKQERWVKYLDTKKEIHFIAEGTDITAKVQGRKWINCDGKLNFPDGEIFTSPIEDSLNGYITFTYPSIYMGQEVEGIKLEVKGGKVVKWEAEKGYELLDALIKTDEGASYFGEVAIGTNYGIKRFTKNILFDEKIGGSIHMAIGNSLDQAGGKNKSAIHWDMICDMKTNGKIYADEELFYENGYFKDEILEKYGL